MKLTEQMAQQLRSVYFGGNWTAANLKEHLSEVTWEQGTKQVYSFHSIAGLVFHMNYFVRAVLQVLQGGPLDAKDKFSFDCPAIESQADWDELLDRTWADAEYLARLLEELPEGELWGTFSDEKYGNYYRNLHGIIEHNHYHLGQIALIKRILKQSDENAIRDEALIVHRVWPKT